MPGKTSTASKGPVVRVGIVGIWSQGEAKKSELVSILKKKPARPWLEGIDKKFVVERPFNEAYEIEGNIGVATDVAVGAYIEWKYGDQNVAVDFIPPSEMCKERLDRNDLNFHILYDDLEGFHADRSKGKRIWKRITQALNDADNVFPPRYYQHLINNKISYYNFCKDNDIRICPTFTLTKEQYAEEMAKHSNDDEKALKNEVADHYWDEIMKLNWGFRFFCKPVYGIESRDAKMFSVKDKEKGRFRKYFTYIMEKYPGIVIQKYIIGFGAHTDSPEARLLHVGDKYQFTIIQTDDKTYRPAHEDYVYSALPVGKDFPLEKMKAYARSVMNKLPEFKVQGISLPRLTTRIDLGTRLHPAGLPGLCTGKIISINKDAKMVKAECKKKDLTPDGVDTGYVGMIKTSHQHAGLRGEITAIDGGDNTVCIRYLDEPHAKKGNAGKGWYPITTIEGYDATEEITPFVNEIEYCPSLFVEETLHTIDQIVGDQMVNITRQFVAARGPSKKKSSSPMKEITRNFVNVANIRSRKGSVAKTKTGGKSPRKRKAEEGSSPERKKRKLN